MSAFVSSTSTDPDVRAMDSNYVGINFYGWVDCPDIATVGSRWVQEIGSWERTCQPQDLRFNGEFEADFNLLAERRALACHELGHTVGLLHDTNTGSCLQQDTLAHEVTTYSTEDVNHINGEY